MSRGPAGKDDLLLAWPPGITAIIRETSVGGRSEGPPQLLLVLPLPGHPGRREKPDGQGQTGAAATSLGQWEISSFSPICMD